MEKFLVAFSLICFFFAGMTFIANLIEMIQDKE